MELRAEGYTAESIITSGPVEREVLSLANAHDADLFVLGTHGKRGIGRLLFGSEAEALIRHCDHPVFTVGLAVAPPRKETGLFIEIICVAAPGTRSAKAAVYGYRLAQENGARFTLVYAEEPGGPPDPDSWREYEAAFDKGLPKGGGRHNPIQDHFSNESLATDIAEAARKRQADLIVLGVKHAIPGNSPAVSAHSLKHCQIAEFHAALRSVAVASLFHSSAPPGALARMTLITPIRVTD